MKTSTPWSIGSTISGIAARPHTVGAQTDGGVVMRCEAHDAVDREAGNRDGRERLPDESVGRLGQRAQPRRRRQRARARQLASAATYVKATAYVALTAACGTSGRNASPHSFA